MSSAQDSQYRTVKAWKSTGQPPGSNPGPSRPTTFFLRSEKEVENSTQRGRKTSRDSESAQEDSLQTTPMASMMSDNGFGVRSLEDTISSTASVDRSLSRTESNVSEASVEAGAEGSVVAGRKRKAGNKVHPMIAATAQRIISGEYAATRTSANGSPMSLRSAESPMRTHLRRGSVSSSINLSQPLTPLKMSPQPDSAMPSTPRSGSPKSFRLSDEEASIASETGSQAIQSSSGEEEDNESVTGTKSEAMPQLVMPSIMMPARRPFTERGKEMGRLKVMVVGPQGVGKTSLIQNICRVCEDVVHVDPGTGDKIDDSGVKQISGIGASTRPYPPWWTDFETRRMLLRRKSMGDGVLERNLTFIDTPGFVDGTHAQQVLQHFKTNLSRTANMETMSDSDLISMLSGEGGVQIDAVIYLFDPAVSSMESPLHTAMHESQAELLSYLCKWTNVIPLIGRADTAERDELVARKKQVIDLFDVLKAEAYIQRGVDDTKQTTSPTEGEPTEPFVVSSAPGDDPETIDASVLMSSTYLPPLVPSELDFFVSQLLEPNNTARLRHLSATKFLLWRQENLGIHLDLQKQMLLKSPRFESNSHVVTGSGNMADDPSKVLVPHGSSSYYRSPSPSASDSSALFGGNVMGTSAYALARYNDNKSPTEPFRQVRLAKWAQDLQRSLDNERRRYKQMYANPPLDATSSAATDSEKASDPNHSLVHTSYHRPGKGLLGGEMAVIDPRDPLGVLAFSQAFKRQGWFALQIAGGCGLIGAVAWWVTKNWVEVQEFLGLVQPTPVTMTAVPAPTKGWLEDWDWKGLFGWER